MPTYEYKCPITTCTYSTTIFHKMNETKNILCPYCVSMGNAMYLEKQLGAGQTIRFVGTGFYETDYK